MRAICVVLVCALLAPALAAAQPAPASPPAPPLPTTIAGQVDIAASTLGLQAAAPAAPTASIGTGCSNQPITHDAAIWSVIVYGTAIPPGAALTTPGTSVYTLPTHPGHVFVPVVDTASIPPVRVQLHERVYTAAVTNNFGLLVLTFGPMTLSDTGDFLTALETSEGVRQALRSATMSARVFDFTDSKAPGRTPSQFYEQELLKRLGTRPNPADFATTLQSVMPAPVVQPATLTLELNRASLPAARNAVNIMTGAAPAVAGQDRPLFIVDEPCLQLAVSPLVAAADQPTTAVSFRARYDFYNPMGRRFLKLRAEGDGAGSGTYYDRVEGTLDVGLNRSAARSVLSLSATGAYSYTRESGSTRDAWRAVVKAQLQAPNLAGKVGALPGAMTSPLLSFELGGAGGNRLTGSESDWLARTTGAFTGRFTTRFYVDVRGVAAVSGSRQFAGRDRYAYGSAQLRFNVNRDWDYLIKYECGRKDPDYQKFCGGQSGLALTLGR